MSFPDEVIPWQEEGRPITPATRVGVVLLVMIIAVASGLAYLQTATKTYAAEADVLITPVPAADETLTGLGLIDDADPTRPVQTAARLAQSASVAREVRDSLRLRETTQQILATTEVAPVAESDIISVRVEASRPLDAKVRADAFSSAFVGRRDQQLKQEVSQAIADIRSQRPLTAALRARISELQLLGERGDPTVRIETRASLPREPSSPKPVLTVLVAAAAGLLLGLALLFVVQALRAPRL